MSLKRIWQSAGVFALTTLGGAGLALAQAEAPGAPPGPGMPGPGMMYHGWGYCGAWSWYHDIRGVLTIILLLAAIAAVSALARYLWRLGDSTGATKGPGR
ncbi:MAG: hypothetical protein WCF16_01590 [Alphaproteobacteria bacterium]